MNLIPVNIDSIHIGRPLPFHLVDKDGVLLARKTFVVRSKDDLVDISNRGGGLFIDGVDAEALQRAYLDQLQTLLREDKSLGVIADSKLSAEAAMRRAATDTGRVDWLDLQEQANSMLRDKTPATFMDRLEHIHDVLSEQLRRNADGTLFALIHLSSTETQRYSATHAMLVSVMCAMASREVLKWPEPVENLLRKAAMTMNISMTDLQDKLATQPLPLSSEQRGAIGTHAERSVGLLQQLGITDAAWLEAVREHHTQTPGPLRAKTPAQRLARLIQRADMFAARLAPRISRAPISPAAAMQACYFDENKEVDEAGAALIKAVGIYQPGSFVKLATEEVAVVIRRGANTSTPRVAVLVNRSGMPTVEPTIRDTALKDYRITASVAHRDVRVQINLEKMLPLTLGTASDRPW
jgi:HD-GYP domain-containing protein (c-di-GMP phosphodiesterase class II)